LVVDLTSVWIYSYTGRNHLNPRFPSIQAQVQFLTEKTISLGHQSLVIRDNSNHSLVHVFDLLPGATRQEDPSTIQSKTPITDVALSQAAGGEDQYLVFIDVNHDLFLTTCNNQTRTEGEIFKIGTQIVAVMWSSDTNILVGLHDSACYSVWYAPGEAASDPTLIALTTSTHDLSEFGKNITIESFEGSQLTFQSSGTRFTVTTKIYCEVLHKCVADGSQWTQAVRICRLTQVSVLGCIAVQNSSRNLISEPNLVGRLGGTGHQTQPT
jgi:intraflagellar transport protein 80